MGNLDIAQVDVDYWIDALNRGIGTIATNGSVSNQKGYFATVLHTDQRQLQFQGPCDGDSSLMMSYQTELTGILLV
eukprot:3086525-Ditylum_brightwellii.AAC.1